MNKNTRITPVTPPTGFRQITEDSPWNGEYHGPEAHQGNVAVTSRWNKLNNEIEFDVYSTVDGHSNFDRTRTNRSSDPLQTSPSR